MKHPGGLLRMPYIDESGTIYIVKQNGEEIKRFIVPAQD